MRLLVLPGVFAPPSDAWILADAVAATAADHDVLDVCTGSGIVAVAAALARAARVTAVDVSRRAVANARINARLNGVSLDARRSDLLRSLGGERYDLIAANPPYLPALSPEPARGLDRATE